MVRVLKNWEELVENNMFGNQIPAKFGFSRGGRKNLSSCLVLYCKLLKPGLKYFSKCTTSTLLSKFDASTWKIEVLEKIVDGQIMFHRLIINTGLQLGYAILSRPA
jgi:hypothetical protein